MRKVLFVFLCLHACVPALYGQERFYRPVEGLKKAQLKSALHELIRPGKVLDYGGKGEGYTWAGFAVTDRMPDSVTVRDRYSDHTRRFDGLEAVPGMNIEHVFANSWWGHTVNDAYCDLFNLFPSDASANGRKSNNPMGEVTGEASFDNGVTRVGKSASYREDSLITVWEPADQWKGDFARTYFYMATCYEDFEQDWQTPEGLLVVEKNRYPTLRPWVSRLLLEWNAEDPVDDIERMRNEAVCGIQGNRNPFVDYPQLADYIWGDSTDYAFYTDGMTTEPEIFIPEDGTVIDFGLQAVAVGMDRTFMVRGRNLPEGLSLRQDSPAFELDVQSLSGDEITRGKAVGVACRPGIPAGVHETALLLSDGRFEQSVTLRVEFVDGVPAYPAQDVVCTVAAKRFTASWMDMGEEFSYELEVYTKDTQGHPHMCEGYPLTTDFTSARVEGLKASTTYYYKVNATDRNGQVVMSSEEVEVVMPDVTPVFTANVSEMSFSSVPGRPSVAQTVEVTALEVPQYVTTATVEPPFEVSANGVEWSQAATLSGFDPQFLVRLGEVPEEGPLEGEMWISTPGVRELVVSLSAEVNAQKSFFETFETGSKGAYAVGEVTCAAATWRMAQTLIGNLENDRKNGEKSVRMQAKNGVATELEMTADHAEGCDSLWFYAGLYGSDSGVRLSVSYSQDGGMTWKPVAENMGFVKGEWKRYGYKLGAKGFVRLKFTATGSSSKRLNIDDIQMSDYRSGETGIATPDAGSHRGLVDVYTLGGVRVRTAVERKNALRGLKPDYYLVK